MTKESGRVDAAGFPSGAGELGAGGSDPGARERQGGGHLLACLTHSSSASGFGDLGLAPILVVHTLPPTNMEVQKGKLTKRKVVFLQGSVRRVSSLFFLANPLRR